ncbi:hypothetical protein FQZ97_1031830 [compost metagenome]
MRDLLVGRKFHLHGRTQRANNLRDVIGLVINEADAAILWTPAWNIERMCAGNGCGSERRKNEGFSYQLIASGSERYSLTTKPSGLTSRSVEDIGALA